MPSKRPRLLTLGRFELVVLLAAVVILAVVATAYTMATIRSSASDPAARGLLQTRDRVLVSDFSNQTGDSTLGVVLAEALRVDIAQSPHVRVLTTALERAFAQRERLPLRERYLTMGSYYRVVTREYDKAAAAYRALLELYPQDLAGLNNIALVYFADRQFARADSFFSQVIALDSTIPSVYLARAEALISQSRFDSVRHVLDRVWERFPEYPQTRLTEAYLAAARQDWPTAERHLRLRLAASRDREFDQINARQMLGQIALLGGRLAEADQHLTTALELAQSNELSGRYLTQTILLAWLDLLYRRQPARALARVDSALQKFPLAGLDPADRPYIELADLYTAADQPARARALLAAAERDSAAAATLRGAGWHELRGIVALAEGRARAAVSELRQADAVHSCTICVLPNLANAYRLAGDAQNAIATYERYLATPWIWRFETDAPHMAFSLQQLAQLYRLEGQPARAAEQYMRLLRLWSAADPELSAVVDAVRASLARAGGATETR